MTGRHAAPSVAERLSAPYYAMAGVVDFAAAELARARRRFLSGWVGDDPFPEPATPARVSGPVCTGGVFCHVPGHVVYRDQGGGYQAVHIRPSP